MNIPTAPKIPTAPSAAQNIFREFPALTPQPKNLKYGGKKNRVNQKLMGFHGYHQTNKARFPYENFLRLCCQWVSKPSQPWLYRWIKASGLGNVNEHVACGQILAVGIKQVDFTLKNAGAWHGAWHGLNVKRGMLFNKVLLPSSVWWYSRLTEDIYNISL